MGFQTWKQSEEVPRVQALSDAYELQKWIREQANRSSGRYPEVEIRRVILFLERETHH